MTTMLTTTDVATMLQHLGVKKAFDTLAGYIQQDFIRWNSFEKKARISSHCENGVIEFMPTADAERFSFKLVNGHPYNPRQGLPTVMAFGALCDTATGTPLMISELTLTTAMRTAATSIMAARVLARPDARIMAMIGNGAQSEFQALAFHYLLGIDTIKIFDIDTQASRKLMANLANVPGLKIELAASVKAACAGADIVTTITADQANALILTPDMIEPGMHINAVGGDCPGKTELHPDILLRTSTFIEFEPQTREEGEIQQMPQDYAVIPLWEVLAGMRPGRQSATEITLFDSVGFALEDYSALRFLWDQAHALGLGAQFQVTPEAGDPKDLFGAMQNLARTEAALQEHAAVA